MYIIFIYSYMMIYTLYTDTTLYACPFPFAGESKNEIRFFSYNVP